MSSASSSFCLSYTDYADRACPLLSVPAAVMLLLSDTMLDDTSVSALAATATWMLHTLQRYRWKSRLIGLDAMMTRRDPRLVASAAATDSLGRAETCHRRIQPCFGSIERVLLPALSRAAESGAELSRLLCALPRTVTDVAFDVLFNSPVESIPFPSSLTRLDLGGCFNRPISGLRLPDALTDLTLSWQFNYPLDGVELPSALRRLALGNNFSHSLSALPLPDGLQELDLGAAWELPLSELPHLPDSLLVLTLGRDWDHPLETLQQAWPPLLHTLNWSGFDQSLVGAPLPPQLRQIEFGNRYSHSLVGIRWPTSLTSISFRWSNTTFEHSISGVQWPPHLRTLELPATWRQRLDSAVQLPASLLSLSLGDSYNQSLRDWDPPASLTHLDCGSEGADLTAAYFRLPAGLIRFRVPDGCSSDLADFALPAGLRSLELCSAIYVRDPSAVRFPAGLTELDCASCALPSLGGFAWPPNLRRLMNVSVAPLLPAHLPSTLTCLELSDAFGGPLLEWADCPASLRRLKIGGGWRQPFDQLRLPRTIEALEVEEASRTARSLDGLSLPESMRALRLRGTITQSLSGLCLPAALRVLSLPSDQTHRSVADLPAKVPAQLRLVEVASDECASVWRDWIASCPAVLQRGCVVSASEECDFG